MGCEHAMEADEVQPRTGNQCGKALHEFQGFHDDMGGAISVRCLQREHHLPGTVERWALVGKSRAGDVPTEVFELMTPVDGEPHVSMQAEALLIDAAVFGGRRHSVRDGLQGQHFLARPGPERDPVGAGRRLQGCQGALRKSRTM